MTVPAIVDTGAWTLVINEETREKLGIMERGRGEATLELVGVHGDKEMHRV
jgi:predicted aspartyl protease